MKLSKEIADKIARKTRAAANRSARIGGHETHIYGLGNGAFVQIEVQVFRTIAELKKAKKP